MLEVTMVFFVIIVFSQPWIAITNMALGVILAMVSSHLLIPDFSSFNHSVLVSDHLHVMIYTLLVGLIFSRSNLKGQLAQEKLDTVKELTTCIALEMKNPINQIRYRIDLIQQRLPHPGYSGQSHSVSATDMDAIYREISKCRQSVNWGAQVIEMTMDEMGFTPIDKTGFRHLSAAAVTRKAVDEFSYQNASDRSRVLLMVREDFVFNGDETRYVYVLFNLLKNATYYFNEHLDARIMVIVDEQRVTVEDTGPGMKPDVLARAFEPFHSVGKPGGTGLGLSFCKRTMQAFGGRITCESSMGSFTRFVMRFPRISNRDLMAYEDSLLTRAKEVFQGKQILIVDDAPRLRASARAVLGPLGVRVDEAEDGRTALEMLARKRYDAMLLDLSMPVLDGYDTAETIRRGGVPGLEHMPIVVHSAEGQQPARSRLDRIGVDAFIPKGSKPLEIIDALCRAHASAAHRQETLASSSTLAGKTLLLADGEAFSRKSLRAALQERGMRVIDVGDGRTAMNMLTGAIRIDVVLTDMQMPMLDGLGIARAIRLLPPPLCSTPVIAMGTQCGEALFTAAQEAGIDEFLEKPVDLMELFQKLNQQLAVVVDAGALSDVLSDVRTKLGILAHHVALNNHDMGQELMHAILELAGQINARAFHAELRALYDITREKGQWPTGDWLTRLQDLFAEVEKRFSPAVPA
ncbi:ATP-binding response regulator [Hydrogenophaga laconesensis]|uniref:histidine kinase n=1 Tax=Hydrogenophaga laconesensis TaxID=1805971 RepID=A0ABU1V5D0_9BURK|nr:response regulator [Hydrogenophaga laconesensis]MDR7092656.1 CheY-like chemotaxis protein [Hydrogenophaga laconesensis]